MADDRVVVFRGSPTLAAAAEAFQGPTIDDAYEADLKLCRATKHAGRFFQSFVDGLEVLVCSRCETRFQETP